MELFASIDKFILIKLRNLKKQRHRLKNFLFFLVKKIKSTNLFFRIINLKKWTIFGIYFVFRIHMLYIFVNIDINIRFVYQIKKDSLKFSHFVDAVKIHFNKEQKISLVSTVQFVPSLQVNIIELQYLNSSFLI